MNHENPLYKFYLNFSKIKTKKNKLTVISGFLFLFFFILDNERLRFLKSAKRRTTKFLTKFREKNPTIVKNFCLFLFVPSLKGKEKQN